MGAKTKFSASEAASAMEYMAMAGWKTSDMLNGIEGVSRTSRPPPGEDLATTSDIVTDALTAFGLSAADSGHFADIPRSRFLQCEHQRLHDGRDVQVLCAYCRCAGVLGRGYRRSHRTYGK
ncbi:MAG: phage tail tape measure protein [Subdoligranulum sp.]